MEAPLRDFFDEVWAISLDSRPDRWEWFEKRFLGPHWPFKPPQRFHAIDGKVLPWPKWWTQGAGAWGIYRSNLRIIEDAIIRGVKSVLILEDDAILDDPNNPEIRAETFSERVAEFLQKVPADWEQIYLGGQHLFQEQHPPRSVNDQVVVPYNVNRLHAHALSHAGLRVAYKHLTAHRWQTNHHIDHHFGVLHQEGGIKVYAPAKWLIGQSADRSDISCRELPVRFWSKSPKAPQGPPTVIAVLGPYRGGTSCVAGAMHHLGILMGHQFFSGGRQASPKGCFEAKRLYDICLQCYPEPGFQEGVPFGQRVKLLKGWLNGRRNEQPVIGAKHPKLCLMIPEMLEAWPNCKFVVVHRPIEESVQSLRKLGWWSQKWKPEDLIHRLVDARDQSLSGLVEYHDHTSTSARVLRLSYDTFLRDPRTGLRTIAHFAEIEPLEEQYQKAIAHVDPSLKHYGGAAC